MTLNPANNQLFKSYVIDAAPIAAIQKALSSRKKEDRNNTILRAVLYINRYIKKRAESFSKADDAKDFFVNLVKFLTDTVQIVRFIVRGDEAAYTIFETLNDRGLELAPLDLVKNYLFSRAERHRIGGLRDLEERWTEMMTILGSVKPDSFLRAFWASRHGKTEGTKLYKEFKKSYNTPDKTFQVAIDMRESAESYAAIFNSDDPIWSKYSNKSRKSIDALITIGSSQMHPMVLAALDKFNSKEMERLLHLLEVIAVRYQLVARRRPGRIESLGGRTAHEITEGKITKAAKVHSELRELYIEDSAFRNDFAVKSEKEGKKARYLLSGLERQSLLRAGETFADELVPGNVTLEHIFPKSPGEYWSAEVENDPQLAADCLHRLGNMCLLPEVNRALGNKRFPDKKDVFGKSRLRITQSVAEYDSWGRAAIEKRQKHFAELAVAEWRFQ